MQFLITLFEVVYMKHQVSVNLTADMRFFIDAASHICVTLFLMNVYFVYAIWPPPYSVNLSQEETFVISELLRDSDVQDVYDEEEMIKKEDLAERQNPYLRNDKYFRIHRQVRRYNDKFGGESSYNTNKTKMYKELNPDAEEPVPWKAGFVDEEGRFKPDEGVVYFDGEPENFGDKLKRSDEEGVDKNDSISYDYNNFKAGYDKEIKDAENSGDTLKYSTVKEEESLKDAVKEMIDFRKTPKNCTAEEMNGIGLGAVECFWMEMKKPRMKSRVFEKAIRIIVVWIILYIVVAVPCWCQYGWGCCCCRCRFCRPRENISEVQKFFAENPVGVYHDEKGNVYNYKPTAYEIYAYRKLERELNKL